MAPLRIAAMKIDAVVTACLLAATSSVVRAQDADGAPSLGEVTVSTPRGAAPVFDVPGSVAKSTHAGIPWLRFIRQRLRSRVHFWPFDGWDIPAGRSAIAEVYPSLWRRDFPSENRTPDQHDAFCIAAWFVGAAADGTLPNYLNPDLTPAERAVAQVEGWIMGVAGPRRTAASGCAPRPNRGSFTLH